MDVSSIQPKTLLLRYLLPQRGAVVWMGLLLLAGTAFQLASPQIIRFFLDSAQAGENQRVLLLAAAAFIAFALGHRLLDLLAGYASDRVSWTATNRLRRDLTLHVLRLDMPFHKQHTPGELIERIDGDVTGLANFLSAFVIRAAGSAVLLAGILLLLYREDLLAGGVMTVYILITLALLQGIQRIAIPAHKAARQAAAEQYGFMEERISGVEDIRAVGGEPYVMRRLYALMRTYLYTVRRSYLIGSLTYNLTNLVHVAGYAAGLALGAYLYTQQGASLGTAYLIVHYAGMLYDPLQQMRAQMQDLQGAVASAERVGELFALQPQVQDAQPDLEGEAAPVLPVGALSASFQEVSFHYEENPNVLHGVSFDLPPGRVLGVLGRTGSGKSTLTRLLFRLYDASQGSICLGGHDLRHIPLGELRRRVGMVTQDVQLFDASVRDNLSFFDLHVSDQRLEVVLRELRLWDWIASLPGGLDARLLAGGQGLSAGEAQLLAFARVFLKDPGLVILDEASSRLDPATENLLERAVDRLLENRTGVIIAHRLKTIQRVDDILILENGSVVEYGPRQVLAQDPGSRFSRLLQTGLEEVLA
jgi:ATP-binding cassette, subfamily B, bacterial